MVDAVHGGPRTSIRVSTIIPCHNGERYIDATIRSVLHQGCEGLEIIVVDDGSTDRSPELVRAFGDAVRYVRQPQGGASRARNRGIELATGQAFAFLDADDLWPEGALSRMVAKLESDPSIGMVVGQMEQFVSPELPAAEHLSFRFSPDAVPARMCGTVLVRRAEFERVGGFAPELASGEFIDWLARAEHLGVQTVAIDTVVLRRRLHLSNHGVVRRDARQDYLRVVKAALDRKRATAPRLDPA